MLHLRCRMYLQIRSSLTMCTHLDGSPCVIHVLQASSFLLALAVNTRSPLLLAE
eukprot:m.30309 g.30309  ORF g.30309 m.30309 type:complete len:54 (-) comp41054_c0_seq1:19-180(-)